MKNIIESNLDLVISKINSACSRASRNSSDVTLIVVSKTFPTDIITHVVACGHENFGENKLQEAEQKICHLPKDLCWHYLGRIQRNKVAKILKCFPVIHSLDSLPLADFMNEVAGKSELVPKVFLQINLACEASKTGFSIDELVVEIHHLMSLKNLLIVGLMCIPPFDDNPEESRKWFVQLKQLRDELQNQTNYKLPYLSMGMSNDYEIAIEEGSTHVRVGSAIFGNRAILDLKENRLDAL
jgi:pyridoxal phosphate enzyme (YggS family)